MGLGFSDCTLDGVEEVIVPHIREYLHHDPGFEDRLGIFIEASGNRSSLQASVVGIGYCCMD